MEIILLVAALIVSFLVFTWLVRVVKATVTTAITIAIIVLILQIIFGVGPGDFFQTLGNIWQGIWDLIMGDR